MSLWGWHVLIILAACGQFFIACSPYSYNVFFTELQLEFEQTALIISWVGALGSGLVCLASPLTAIIGSKIGSYRLLLLGIVLHSAGYLALSFSPTIAYCFVTFSITGIGSCCLFSASGNFMLEWFSGRKNVCAVTSAGTTGSSIGVMIQGPVLTILSAAHGWRNCCRILSGFGLVFSFFVGLPFLSSPKHKQLKLSTDKKTPSDDQERSSKEEKVAMADRDIEEDGDCKTFKDNENDVAEFKEIGTSTANNGNVLLNVEVWLWVTSITLSQFGWSFMIINYSSFVDTMGLDTDKKSVALLIMGAAEVGGKVLYAVFGDHLPFFKLYAIALSSAIAAIVSVFLTISSSFGHLLALSLVWGMLRGVNYGSCFSAADELFHSLGSHSVTSVVLFGYGLGVILGASVTGALYDLTGNYSLSLVVLVAIFFMSALSMVTIPVKRRLQIKCFTAVKPNEYRYQTANFGEQTEVKAVTV
ncbi:monocarboxylate transporter 5-like [Asterias rubens]|uniref:monocarboxylate transporter 5-like n=1 Tax=Asterias rubens TaxID=7604 RepID=UPI0014553995|nr:monocarboxylate transporter 5-like [Asterias rubens]